MIRHSISIVLIFLQITASASHIFVAGDVSGTWDADTVFVTKDILVPDQQSLTIEPGVLVIFQGYYLFEVAGSIHAQGTHQEQIRFTAEDTTGFHDLWEAQGGWRGLRFHHVSGTNDSSVFAHCRFEFGKAAYDEDSTLWYGGAACIREFNRLRFSSCTFQYNRAFKNGGAVYAKDADIIFNACHFADNFCGLDTLYGYGGGLCLEYSDAPVTNCLFEYNVSTGVGGGLSFEHSDPRIGNNIFRNNFSALGGGMVCLRSDGLTTIAGNLFHNNSAYFFGGGIALIQATMLFTNNTLAFNTSGAGGGLYFNESCFSVFKNTILWGNADQGGGGPQVYIWDTFSAPEFYYCDVEGGEESFGGTGGLPGGFIGIYENNLESDPEFTASGDHPFGLQEISPCIDAGSPDTTGLQLPALDLAGNPRFSGPGLDIGAYEAEQSTFVTATDMDDMEIRILNNPFRDFTEIHVICPEEKDLLFSVYDQAGNPVYGPVSARQDENRFLFRWDGKDHGRNPLKPGLYFVEIRSGKMQRTVKLIRLP